MDKELAGRIIGRKVKEVNVVGSGYHSSGYKVSAGKDYFIKEIKTSGMGFEFPERKIYSLLVSHGMNMRSKASPRSLKVVSLDGKEVNSFTKIDENCRVFEVQEFGGDGVTLYDDFQSRDRKDFDASDIDEIEHAIDFITSIHRKHPDTLAYNDYLRQVIGQPEYTLQLIQSTDLKDCLFDGMSRMVVLMLRHMVEWKGREDRCVQLHGDFWPANCILGEDGSRYYIDYSRMPYGDPGFDIGFWCSAFAFNYIRSGKKYYKKYVDEFLRRYTRKTGDDEIMKTMIYPMAMLAIAYVKKDYVPGFDDKARKRIFSHVLRMMEKKSFFL